MSFDSCCDSAHKVQYVPFCPGAWPLAPGLAEGFCRRWLPLLAAASSSESSCESASDELAGLHANSESGLLHTHNSFCMLAVAHVMQACKSLLELLTKAHQGFWKQGLQDHFCTRQSFAAVPNPCLLLY